MTSTVSARIGSQVPVPLDLPTGLAVPGSASARLLAGPAGREDLRAHLDRLGPQNLAPGIFDTIAASGLTGRGGGHFPLAAKLRIVRRTPGRAVVVVNATESEPASGKDRYLMLLRPHLILDGAQAVAAAVDADRVLVAVHPGRPAESLRDAVLERGPDRVAVAVVDVPDRYVAGESSAVVSWINGGRPIPAGRSWPTAVSGVGGRPTVVSNAETLGHVALIARRGAEWFRDVGPPAVPGSVLVTVAGDVSSPGQVFEVVGRATVGQAVVAAGGAADQLDAILVGGYSGRWQPAGAIWDLPLDPAALAEAGSPIGCGLLGVLGAGRCGLAEASRLAGWLSSQRAGQCGSCDAGLPALADAMARLAEGRARGRRALGRIAALGDAVAGRNLCHLPDGAVGMVESALTTFWEELALHGKRRCSGRTDGPLFPIPVGRPDLAR